jgi:intracellular multiplication protein IcmP
MQKKSSSDSMAFIALVLLLLIFLGVYFYWRVNHSSIVFNISRFYWYVLDFIDIGPNFIKSLKTDAYELATYSYIAPFNVFFNFLNRVGYIFVPIPIIFTIYLIYKIGKIPTSKINRLIDIKSLPKIMAVHCPAIIPSLYYGDKNTLLLNDDPVEHKSALDPVEWVKENNLLINRLLFDRAKCKKLLIEQLGKKINDINELTDCEKTIFTVFASRLFTNKPETAIQLTDKLNYSCHTHTFNGKKGYPDLKITDSLFNEYVSKYKSEINKLINIYSYSRTILYAMHIVAVKKGKLPSSYFRWLKGMDRGLFYVLNTTGRKTPFIESTGVFGHYLWCDFNNKNNINYSAPMLEEAIDGIENYLVKAGELELIK